MLQLFGPVLIIALIGGAADKAFGQTQQFIARDTMGRELGRAVTDTKGNTTFYNEKGQTTGRAATSNGTTTTYNQLGQQTGTIRSNRK